jgi:hypothetical protein
MVDDLKRALGIEEDATTKPEVPKANGAAKDSRLAVATDFVCSVLFAGGGSAPALEIEKRARAAGLLKQGGLIGQSRMFRQIKKSLSVEVYRRGFGKGSMWIWQIPGTVVRVGELEPEPIDAATIEADRVINEPPIAAATMSPAAQIDGVASEEAAVINGEPPIAAATIEAVANRQSEEKAAINDAPPISPPAAPRSSEPRPSHWERCADNQEARAAAAVQQWQEGFRSLDPGRPPPLVPCHAWTEFIRASAQFLNSPLALRAVRLGWDALSLFGFPPHGGLTARSELGPLWIGRMLEIDSAGAVVEYAGAKRAYTKRPPGSRIRVPWDIERWRPIARPAPDARRHDDFG